MSDLVTFVQIIDTHVVLDLTISLTREHGYLELAIGFCMVIIMCQGFLISSVMYSLDFQVMGRLEP